jgi:hypothetical protein
MAGRPLDRKKERFWRDMVRRWARWRRDGGTVRDFCVEQGLAEQSFYAWRRTLAQRAQQAGMARQPGCEDANNAEAASPGDDLPGKGQPGFLALGVLPTAPAQATPLELVLAQDRIVRVSPGFDGATLRQLLAVLEEELSC